MTAPNVYTFCDVLDRIEAFLNFGGVGVGQVERREIARESYREVVRGREWSFLQSNARIPLRAAQTTGTVVFDLTGGANERQLTLTGSTWPEAWVKDASVRLGSPAIVCDVEDYISPTVVTLDTTMAPIADVASTTYKLFPRWYRLPTDFATMGAPMGEDSWTIGELASKEEIERLNRSVDTTGSIEKYAVGSPLDLYGAMALYTDPPSDATKTLDLPYRRKPRDIVYAGRDTRDSVGTITTVVDSAAVVGVGTSFASGMVNSILRIGEDATTAPGGKVSQYPYAEQRVIKAVTDTTNLTLDAGASVAVAAKRYRISDPVDIDEVLYDAFIRCCEKNLAQLTRAKNAPYFVAQYKEAMLYAREADRRATHPRVAGPSGRGRGRGRLTDSTNRDQTGFG